MKSGLFAIFFLLPIVSAAATYDPILAQIKPGTITIIGESHKHIESAKLIKDLVTSAVIQGQCLTLALEIEDKQQAAIDRVFINGASVYDIDIPSSIDHKPMRWMIKHMAMLKMKHPCLNVVAIDAGIDNPHDRDEWMATKLSGLAGDQPILLLIGALHSLKKVDWLVSSGKPSVAELLAKKGFRVRSYPQRWLPDRCGTGVNRSQRFVSAESMEALAILNDSLISLINAKPQESALGVVDGLFLWECGGET